MVWNPIAENWGIRSPLSLFVSYDNGISWEKLFDLEQEKGEFSYPALVYEDSFLYLTYPSNRKNFVFRKFSETYLYLK